MLPIKIQTTTDTQVTIDGKPVYEVLKMAAELAHEVLEELSIYRQRNNITEDFGCEASACEFLDTIGD